MACLPWGVLLVTPLYEFGSSSPHDPRGFVHFQVVPGVYVCLGRSSYCGSAPIFELLAAGINFCCNDFRSSPHYGWICGGGISPLLVP